MSQGPMGGGGWRVPPGGVQGGFQGRQDMLAMFRLTPAIKWLLVSNVAVYVIELVVVNWVKVPDMMQHLAVTPARVVPGLEIWQLATALWMHHPQQPSHIIMNMFGLWMFGTLLEQRWGSTGFLKFYVLTGVFANAVVVAAGWISGTEDTMTLGASGAVYAVVVAFGLLFPNLRIWFFGLVPMKAKWMVIIVLGGTVLSYLARAPGISIAAHAGGMAISALLLTGWWNPANVYRSVRRLFLRRRLRVVERRMRDIDDRGDSGPMIH